ncbi:MAG: FAD-binding protein [Gemmatimonadota bacterium]|nr:FAD-binding protein [Gemmatimonadota bacterium]
MRTRQSVAGPLADRLRRHVEGDVRFDALTRSLYATDASIYQIRPVGVVLPRSLDDVDAVMTIAREEGVPVLPRGAGTSQCGQAIGRALVIDTSRHLDQVLAVDQHARTARVEPGVVLDQLNRQLAPTGLFFPVDVATASRATIGGMAGNNSGGARSIRYGIMADNVTAIEAALADGRVVDFGPRSPPGGRSSGPADAPADARRLTARIQAITDREADELRARVPGVLRHVAGYNLHRLLNPDASMAEVLVGSEGTLAFFRRLTLRLARKPRRRVLGVCGFPSLLEALDAVQHIVELDPHAVELVDDTLTGLARENAAFRSTVEALIPASAHSVLLVEFAGDDEARLSRRLGRLEEVVHGTGPGREMTRAEDPAEQAAIWAVRRAGLNIVMSMKGDRKPVSIVEDCAIPLPALAEFGAAVEDIFARHGTSSTWYAHASVGCLHVRPSLNMKDPSDIAAFRSIGEEVMRLAVRLGGSHSGEHGDGILRSEFIEPMLGSRLARAFREVKEALDPAGMMNPGKIVGAPRMDDRELFRYGPRYRARALPLASDWSSDGGFVRAVEACNNNGACRKMDPGVMCPSYRVTREETDTTRGRANVLRLAMTGQLGPEGLEGDEVAEVLELCVGCKACQRECPAGVDMARMKAEVLHLRHQRRGVPLRERLFASLPRVAPIGARFPGLLNLRNRSRALRWLGERVMGIAAANALPEWHPRPFRDAELPQVLMDKFTTDFGNNGSESSPEALTTASVVLFVDTFSRYFDPNVARAAQSVLVRLGHEPVAPTPARARGRPLCCGRTYISAGMLDHARAELRRTVAALAPFARRGLPIVGLEPSCLLTLRDEALHLLADDEESDARAVAEQALLVDEFLAERASSTTPPPSRTTVQIHGHCHQKAAGTASATVEALAACSGMGGALIESSCCGMAGSFGYVARHLRTSRAMGELSLFPALRARAPEDTVIANGFSCRAQIRAGTGRRARHVVEVLAGHLDAC